MSGKYEKKVTPKHNKKIEEKKRKPYFLFVCSRTNIFLPFGDLTYSNEEIFCERKQLTRFLVRHFLPKNEIIEDEVEWESSTDIHSHTLTDGKNHHKE